MKNLKLHFRIKFYNFQAITNWDAMNLWRRVQWVLNIFKIRCSKSFAKFWLLLQVGTWSHSDGWHPCKGISNYKNIPVITFYRLTRRYFHWLPSEAFPHYYLGEEKNCPCCFICPRKGQRIFVNPKFLLVISFLDWFKDELNYEIFLLIDVPWDLS